MYDSTTLKPEIEINEMNQTPILEDDEELIYSFPTYGGPSNVGHVAITTKNLFIRPRDLPISNISNGLKSDVGEFDISLQDIIEIETKIGFAEGNLRIVTESDTIQLDGFNKEYASPVLGIFDDNTELKKCEKEEEEPNYLQDAGAIGLGITGIVTSVIFAIFGLIVIAVGVMLTMTIIGAIFGIPAIIMGVMILAFAGANSAVGIGVGSLALPTKSTKMKLE